MISTERNNEDWDIASFVRFVAMVFGICAAFICMLLYFWHLIPNMTDPKPVHKRSYASIVLDMEREIMGRKIPVQMHETTQDLVYSYIVECEIYEPEIVLRQSILETGWWTSKNCVERNNIFGMKGGKVTDDNPEGYMIYEDWKASVRAYKEWQLRKYNPDYCGTYYDFLESVGYAESPEYTNKLKQIKLK